MAVIALPNCHQTPHPRGSRGMVENGLPPPCPNAAGPTPPDERADVIIWALRRVAVGEIWCPLIDYELRRVYGADAEDLRGALHDLILGLAHHGRRRLRLGLPGLPVHTADECALLSAIGAATEADRPRLRAHLVWILGCADVTPLWRPLLTIGALKGSSGAPKRAVPDCATCP